MQSKLSKQIRIRWAKALFRIIENNHGISQRDARGKGRDYLTPTNWTLVQCNKLKSTLKPKKNDFTKRQNRGSL
jgi:hypothetical protein